MRATIQWAEEEEKEEEQEQEEEARAKRRSDYAGCYVSPVCMCVPACAILIKSVETSVDNRVEMGY